MSYYLILPNISVKGHSYSFICTVSKKTAQGYKSKIKLSLRTSLHEQRIPSSDEEDFELTPSGCSEGRRETMEQREAREQKW